MLVRSFLPVAIFVPTLVLGSTGCVYDNEPPRRLAPDPEPAEVAPPAEESGSSGSDTRPAPGNAGPMLVEVETDQTMSAVGGDGVGVFIEYAKGGHWRLTWTCDTNQTRQSCDFVVGATVASGTVSNVDGSELPSGAVSSPSASRVEAKTTTTTELHTLKFDADPGVAVTVEASVGGLKDGAFLFFVQDGKVNGGFTGKLTNPLQLEPTTP